ncbi:MAG: AhpC/TSA family protein [Bacteroidetes bacterium]|nr:AhpC/TSA family protein [Bacteroidota bacterium]
MKKIISTISLLLAGTIVMAQSQPKGLNTGDVAPDFMAKDQNGKKIELHTVLKKSPVVLVFYRGEWCPYCNRYLSQMQDSLMQIVAKNATVLAVTPEISESIDVTVKKTKAGFSILHDEGLKIMKQYDVAYKVDDATNTKLKGYGINLMKNNGKNGNNLPVPAVYIINKEGKIAYKFFDADYTHRAPIKDILAHL